MPQKIILIWLTVRQYIPFFLNLHKWIITFLFVETPRQFIIANLSIRKTGPSSVLIIINIQRTYIIILYF